MEESFYLSLIREASEGHVFLGNSSLREHRSDRSIVTFFPHLPALFMRIFALSLPTALFLTDLLFPFLTTLFFFLAWRGIFRNDLLAGGVTLIAIGAWEGGLLNVVNPKMVMTLAAAYSALYFGTQHPSKLHYALRGGLLGITLYTYPHYFLLFGSFEVADFLRRLVKRARLQIRDFQELIILSLSTFIISLPYLFLSGLGGKSAASLDLWYRQVIPSRLPAHPTLQIALLLTIALCFFIFKKKSAEEVKNRIPPEDQILTSLFAGLLVLNQSLLHGLDIMFGLHYRLPLKMLIWIAVVFAVSRIIRKASLYRTPVIVLAAYSLFSIITLSGPLLSPERNRIAEAFTASDLPKVIMWLNTQEESVVLAPHELSEIIPVYTPHYVAWNGYANYQSVTDAELARRYVLQELVEPQSEVERDRSYPQVFSVYAGNLAARERTWCQVKSFFRKSKAECSVSTPSKIRNQEALKNLEENLAHLSPELFLTLLREFHVDVIVAENPLPPIITRECPEGQSIGAYTIYTCRESLSMMRPIRFSQV